MQDIISDTSATIAWAHHLAIDKLYAERGVPVGKFQEWNEDKQGRHR